MRGKPLFRAAVVKLLACLLGVAEGQVIPTYQGEIKMEVRGLGTAGDGE